MIGETVSDWKTVFGIIARILWVPSGRDLSSMGSVLVVLGIVNLFVPWGPNGGSMIFRRAGERARDFDFAAWITAFAFTVGVVFIALALLIRKLRGPRA